MDVSRSEAQRAETNVIARSVDRATTITTDAKRRESPAAATARRPIHTPSPTRNPSPPSSRNIISLKLKMSFLATPSHKKQLHLRCKKVVLPEQKRGPICLDEKEEYEPQTRLKHVINTVYKPFIPSIDFTSNLLLQNNPSSWTYYF
jgi:hypothetical protein